MAVDLMAVTPNVISRGVRGKHFLFYGDISTRKTTVASSFPKSLILAAENGYKLIPGVHAQDISSWGDFKIALRQLELPAVKTAYETIVIDTVSLLADLAVQHICNLHGIKELGELEYGKGWTLFKKEFRTAINKITQLGYSVIFITHAEIKRDDTGMIVGAWPQLDKRPMEAVMALVDFALFLQKEPKDETPDTITVYAYPNLSSEIQTKTRLSTIPKRFEFNYENLEAVLEKAVTDYEEIYNFKAKQSADAKIELESFDSIKTSTINLATQLYDKPTLIEKVTTLIENALNGKRLSDTTPADLEILLALRAEFMDLVE